MIARNYYRCLGVSRDASPKEIKRAFRRLVKQNHPDLHPYDANAGLRMREIIAAYKVLSDPLERQCYDRLQDLFGPVATRRTTPPPYRRPSPRHNYERDSAALQRPPVAYVVAVLMLVGLTLVLWAQERNSSWTGGRVRKWTVDPHAAEGMYEVSYANGLSIPPSRRPFASMWELWFWQREYEMNPSGLARRGLLRAYQGLMQSRGKPLTEATTPATPGRHLPDEQKTPPRSS